MLSDILTRLKPSFAPGAHTELRGQLNRSRVVALVGGSLMQNVRTDISGVSARVYRKGACGFSSMAEFTPEAASMVLRAADSNAAFMEAHAGADRQSLPALSGGRSFISEGIHDPEQRIYVEFLKELDEYIQKHCPELISRQLVAMEDSMEKLLVTSDAMDAHQILPRSFCMMNLIALGSDGTPVERLGIAGGEGTFDLNFTSLDECCKKAEELYEQLMQKREGIYADAGQKTVILGGIMTGMLSHEAVGHTVEADLVLGGSVAAHSLGKRVASEKVTLSDFANTAFGKRCPLPVFVDDEGTEARDVTLIKDGILTGYMNNRESALHFGMEPAGNARAWLFSDEPLIRMRNTSIHPGTDKLEDMIASIDDGYYLIESGNGQADTTGEFMFGVTMGYEIKNGKLGRALKDTTVSGVAFDMLRTVDMVGDRVIWAAAGTCGKKQPMPVGMGGPALRCKVMIGGR
ncbi:MAG: TldD/PmbA family protein [Clostridia bacterium]|nr:TldD/PmbA family protein [Clostridia bacterium]